ncbi:MAG: response regulator transcription factor [Ruminococcus sp.]|nr:response regulator transcription factor [Ruminococcus sp.]
MKKILIIDDDIYIGDMLERLLTKNNYVVYRAYSGTEALYFLDNNQPDLILLDLMLPGMNGEEVLSKINGTPVIVVSAKSSVADKVSLLMNGAVDYVTKPFDNSELLARITVAFRNKIVTTDNAVMVFDDVSLDLMSHTVTVSGSTVHLTRTEFAILKLLMQNPEKAISKSVILDRISLDTPDCMESSLKVHISNIRNKLKKIGGKDYIETVWGIGFRMK